MISVSAKLRVWLSIVITGLFCAASLMSPSFGQTTGKEYNSATADELRQREQRILAAINRTVAQYQKDQSELRQMVKSKWNSQKDAHFEMMKEGMKVISDTLNETLSPRKKAKIILDPDGLVADLALLYSQWEDFIKAAYKFEMIKKDYNELLQIVVQKSSRYNAQIGTLRAELAKLEADKQRARSAGLLPPGGWYEPLSGNFTIRSPDRRGEAEWEFFPAQLELTTMQYEAVSAEPVFNLMLGSADADDVARALIEEFSKAPESSDDEEPRIAEFKFEVIEQVMGERQEASFRSRTSWTWISTGYDGVANTYFESRRSVEFDERIVVKSEPEYLIVQIYTERDVNNGYQTPKEYLDEMTEFYLAKRK